MVVKTLWSIILTGFSLIYQIHWHKLNEKNTEKVHLILKEHPGSPAGDSPCF